MNDSPSLDEMVEYVRYLLQYRTLDEFVNSEYWPQACGCMGPRDGWTVCSCRMNSSIQEHKVMILTHIDNDVALKLMRQRIITALAG
jgi:hypothetical protein